MLPDGPFEPSPGVRLRLFSADHLAWQNVFARKSDEEIASRLLTAARESPYWPSSSAALVVAKRLVRRRGLALSDPKAQAALDLRLDGEAQERLEALSDRELLCQIVALGQGLGLGAAWGVSPEADLLWAAAASLLRHHGCAHPNDLAA